MPDPSPADLRDYLALALVPNLGPVRTAALLRRFGSPTAVLQATPAQLRSVPQIGAKLAADFVAAFRTVNVDAELQLIESHNIRLLPLGHPNYPPPLAAIPDPPPLLYLRGELTSADTNAVAIVGTRYGTAYGRRTAEKLAAGLAQAGCTVISGLARGIDGAAHKGTLEANGRTVAVLAGGLARIYPPEHTDLAERIVQHGCLISETPMTMAPQPGMFPARNRIISGLARCVVVVEAGYRSGALITVNHAAEQGREVFAVPGPIDSPASAGCLELIRDGAKLVRSAEDILDDLRGIAPLDPSPVSTRERRQIPASLQPATELCPPQNLDPLQQRIWDALDSPKYGDELARLVGRPVSELTQVLMVLEIKKVIRRLPGNRYERC
jgi:DNA processing protein